MAQSKEKNGGLKVLLFRAPKEGEADPYEQRLSEHQFIPYSIPVLEFQFVNLNVLKECLHKYEDYSAIVFTSQRAVEATKEAIRTIGDEEAEKEEKKRRRYLDLQCCVVGASTYETAQAAGFTPAQTNAGNADKLAEYIIENMIRWKEKPVLYPCGNLRRDTLSVKLKNAGFTLHEIEVYQTVRSARIAEKLQEMKVKKGIPDVVVYFSPSGVKYTVDLLDNGLLSAESLKFVAIGPTTEKELVDRGFTVHATAKNPDAPGVLQAVLEWRNKFDALKSASIRRRVNGMVWLDAYSTLYCGANAIRTVEKTKRNAVK